jgi:SUKH-4 immunity protein of toxin-antitoxin system
MAAIAMVTNKELVDVFGADNVVMLDRSSSRHDRLRPEDVEVLCGTGLPTAIPGLFTIDFDKLPKAFSTITISTDNDGGRMDLLCLGAPDSESEFRYLLNLSQGSIVLLNMEKMMAEVINESLSNFVEFLYRIQQFVQFRSHVSRGREPDDHAVGTLTYAVDILTAYLAELDVTAFGEPECWWWSIFTSGPFKREPAADSAQT